MLRTLSAGMTALAWISTAQNWPNSISRFNPVLESHVAFFRYAKGCSDNKLARCYLAVRDGDFPGNDEFTLDRSTAQLGYRRTVSANA